MLASVAKGGGYDLGARLVRNDLCFLGVALLFPL
jgi:hypothetical protein